MSLWKLAYDTEAVKTCRSIDALSRDTANAHKALSNNFDKDAIRDKLEIQQQATALGTQAVTTYMDSKLDAARKQAREEMAAAGQLDGLNEEEIKKKVEASETFKTADKEYGIGSTFWTTGTAATGLLAGVLGGNVQSGAAAATAPLLAKMIKEATAGKGEAGEVARIALHTLASAVLAKAQGGDSTAGAVGGFIAAAGTKAFALAIYGKDADQLAPDEKMVILNLVAALGAAGGGAVTGNTQGMVSAGNAARVEVENNFLSTGSPQKYTERYKGCGGEPTCEQNIRKDMAKESAENVKELKACIDAKDRACAERVASTIELNEKAYTELRLQDEMAGRTYESVAQHYADIQAHCNGNCDWLGIALQKTIAEWATNAAYGAIGVGSATKPGSGVKPAEPVNSPVVKLERQTTSGLKLTADPSKTTTVLGTFRDDTGAIINELRLPKSTDFGPRKGGFNLLNTPDDLYKNPTQFWNEYNKPWLDNVISRNDSIVLATKPTVDKLYINDRVTGQDKMTGFGREYNYLLENCCIFDSQSMKMIKGK